MANVVAHVKAHGSKWLICVTALVSLGYVIFAIEQQDPRLNSVIGGTVVVLVSALAAVGGTLALIILAATDNKGYGELLDCKGQIILGLLVDVLVSSLVILSSFDIIKA